MVTRTAKKVPTQPIKTDGLVWEAPVVNPGRGRPFGPQLLSCGLTDEEIVFSLQRRPQEWAIIHAHTGKYSAAGYKEAIRAGKRPTLSTAYKAGNLELTARVVNGNSHLYARYVPPTTPTMSSGVGFSG